MKIVLCVLLTLVAYANAGLPIPNQPDGFSIGNANAPVLFELFGDTMCPDTAHAYPTIRQVAAAYGPDKLRLTFHAFTLPFIHSGMLTNQGLWVVAANNATGVWKYIETIFANQEYLWNSQTADLTTNQLIAKIGGMAQNASVLSQNTFVSGMANEQIQNQAITSWKYIASRGIAGTPTFLVNGVEVEADPDWTLQDWQQVLNPLYNTGNDDDDGPTDEAASVCEPRLIKTFAASSNGSCTCQNGETPCQVTPTKCQCCFPGEFCIPNEGCTC